VRADRPARGPGAGERRADWFVPVCSYISADSPQI